MSTRVRAAAKTYIRRASRALGYEIVPAAVGFSASRSTLLLETPTVLDVGANVGQYAERLFDLGFSGRIISYEPGSAAFSALQAKADGHPRWTAKNLGLGEHAGNATLNLSANSVSSSLLHVGELHVGAAPQSRVVGSEDVKIMTLDSQFAAGISGPTFLKLDVQGLEMAVLRGGTEALNSITGLQVEVSFDALYSGQTDWLELSQFLQERGFRLRYIENGYEDPRTGFMLQADLLFGRLVGA